MSNGSFAVNILRRARKNRLNVLITAEEVQYICECTELSNDEKILWLQLACVTVNDPCLSCTLQIDQLTQVYKRSKNEILSWLFNLKQLGYLQVALNIPLNGFCNMQNLLGMFDQVKPLEKNIKSVHCTVILPIPGLKAIMIAPPSTPSQETIRRQRIDTAFKKNKWYGNLNTYRRMIKMTSMFG